MEDQSDPIEEWTVQMQSPEIVVSPEAIDQCQQAIIDDIIGAQTEEDD